MATCAGVCIFWNGYIICVLCVLGVLDVMKSKLFMRIFGVLFKKIRIHHSDFFTEMEKQADVCMSEAADICDDVDFEMEELGDGWCEVPHFDSSEYLCKVFKSEEYKIVYLVARKENIKDV